MLLRWQGVPPTTDPATLIRAVTETTLDRLAASLPDGVPMVDLAGRAGQIASRIADHASRLAV
jgi:hypothetical protein